MAEQGQFESSESLKARALQLGFHSIGVAAAGRSSNADRYLDWLEKGRHASMEYMARNVARRIDPRESLEGAKSVIVVTLPYDGKPVTSNDVGHDLGKIARYAHGRDYHRVMTPMLKDLRDFIEDGGKWQSWYSVDTSPILERDWAESAGVGWIGKNGLVIDPEIGSWFFLGTVVTNRSYSVDETGVDHCGSCQRCIEACPTDAIVSERTIDARRCISYLTIEHRGNFPAPPPVQLNQWLFGCDICQEVCPWNTRPARSQPEIHPQLSPRPLPRALPQLSEIGEEEFRSHFSGTAISRTGWQGIRRNARQILAEGAQTTQPFEPSSDRAPASWIVPAAVIYGSLTLLSLAIMWFRGGSAEIQEVPGTAPVLSICYGGLAAAGMLFAARLASKVSSLKRLENALESIIGRISPLDAFALAAMSAIGEEFLFRGALQPTLGIIMTSLIFGLCHVAPLGVSRWSWPLLSSTAGFVFGALKLTSGGLLAPIVAHFLFNWIQLARLSKKGRQRSLPTSRDIGGNTGLPGPPTPPRPPSE